MESKFSATPSILGILYQLKEALHNLLITDDEDSILFIEKSDDILIKEEGNKKVFEIKNHDHSKNQNKLSLKSSDLWKSLRIWTTLFLDQSLSRDKMEFFLITTEVASDEISPLINGDEEGIKEILLKLEEIAKNEPNKSLRESYKKFLEIKEKYSFIKKINILDSSPGIVNIDEKILKALKYSIRQEHSTPFLNQLFGWWNKLVQNHLINDSKDPILKREVINKIHSLRDEYSLDSLPTSEFKSAIPSEIDPDNDDRIFVQQLKHIDLSMKRIEHSIIDYYRAFNQRQKWIENLLVGSEELKDYETILIEEWERIRELIFDEYPENLSESQKKEVGKKIFNKIETDVQEKIRVNVTDSYVQRGFYQILANNENDELPKVIWHPDFMDKIRELLEVKE